MDTRVRVVALSRAHRSIDPSRATALPPQQNEAQMQKQFHRGWLGDIAAVTIERRGWGDSFPSRLLEDTVGLLLLAPNQRSETRRDAPFRRSRASAPATAVRGKASVTTTSASRRHHFRTFFGPIPGRVRARRWSLNLPKRSAVFYGRQDG